jgi:hypothetical protein
MAIIGVTIFLPYFGNQTIKIQSKKVSSYDDRLEKAFPGNSEILWVAEDSTKLKVSYILK